MTFRPKLAALLLACLSPLAAAHNYTYLEGGLVSLDQDEEDDDTGLRLAGMFDVAPQAALFGEYADADEYSQLSLGAIFHMPVSQTVDIVAGGSLERVDVGRRDDTGFGLRGGVRWQVVDARFELNPELRFVDVFDDTLSSLRVAGLVRITPALDLQGAVQGGDDDRFELGVRYNFAPRRTAAR